MFRNLSVCYSFGCRFLPLCFLLMESFAVCLFPAQTVSSLHQGNRTFSRLIPALYQGKNNSHLNRTKNKHLLQICRAEDDVTVICLCLFFFWLLFMMISHPDWYHQTLPTRTCFSGKEQVTSCPAASLTALSIWHTLVQTFVWEEEVKYSRRLMCNLFNNVFHNMAWFIFSKEFLSMKKVCDLCWIVMNFVYASYCLKGKKSLICILNAGSFTI